MPVRRRGKNAWQVKIDVGHDESGRRRQLFRTVKGTKREALVLEAKLIAERDSGIDIRPERLTVSAYLGRWLSTYAENNVAPSTLLRYRQLVNVNLIPFVGGVVLNRLRPLDIQTCYSGLLAKGLAPRTVLHAHRLLHEALAHAVRWQLISRNPVDAVEPPRPPRGEVKALDVADILRIFDAADRTRYGVLVRLAVLTGMRSGELRGLRWQDIDFDASILYVRQTAQYLPGQMVTFKPPKTHRSARPVALSAESVGDLREHRKKQLERKLKLGPAYQDHDLVFPTALGKPIDPQNMSRAWKAIARATGLANVRFHDLRHAHATLLLQQGTHPKVVSERLGHASVGITLDLYSHVLPGLQADAAAALGRRLLGSEKRANWGQNGGN